MAKNKSVAINESFAELVNELVEDKVFTTKKKVVEQAIKLFHMWHKSPQDFFSVVGNKDNQPHVYEPMKEVEKITSKVLAQLPTEKKEEPAEKEEQFSEVLEEENKKGE